MFCNSGRREFFAFYKFAKSYQLNFNSRSLVSVAGSSESSGQLIFNE